MFYINAWFGKRQKTSWRYPENQTFLARGVACSWTTQHLQSTHHVLYFTIPNSQPRNMRYTLLTVRDTSPHYKSHFTLRTPHFALHTLHSTLQTLLFTLYTIHFITPLSTLDTLHSTLRTPNPTLDTLHSARYTPHSTIYTSHATLHIPSALHTLHSTLHSSHSTCHSLHFTLHTPCHVGIFSTFCLAFWKLGDKLTKHRVNA